MTRSMTRCFGIVVTCLFCFALNSQAYDTAPQSSSVQAFRDAKAKGSKKAVQAYRDVKNKGNNPAQAYRDVKNKGNNPAQAYRDVKNKANNSAQAKNKANAAPAQKSNKQSRAVAQKSSAQTTQDVIRAVEKDCLFPQKVYLLGKALEGGPAGFECDNQGENCQVSQYRYEGQSSSLTVDPYARDPLYDEKIIKLTGPEAEFGAYFAINAKRGQVLYGVNLVPLEGNKWLVAVSFNREDDVAFTVSMEKEAESVSLDMLSKLVDEIHRTRQQLPGVKQFPQAEACRTKLGQMVVEDVKNQET